MGSCDHRERAAAARQIKRPYRDDQPRAASRGPLPYNLRTVAGLIRALGPDDAAVYREQRIRALREHPDVFGRTPEEVPSVEAIAEQFRLDAGSEEYLMLGAFEGPALLGVAGCDRQRAVKQRHIAFVWGIYVVPEQRRTGLGRRLVVELIARARTWRGLECLWLDVTTVNASARALYASLGFRGVAIKPRVLKVADRYYDEELMVLDLGA
jgi:ribosomal protein S18 acetylase RimI-like enzyme